MMAGMTNTIPAQFLDGKLFVNYAFHTHKLNFPGFGKLTLSLGGCGEIASQ